MKKNAVALAGIETVRNKQGKVIKLSVTFLNNVLTWQKDHIKEYYTAIVDCRDFKDEPSPMSALWEELARTHGEAGIDRLFISCHSDWEGLYLYSKIRKELGEEDRYVTVNRDWSTLKFNQGAEIWLSSCQAGGRFGKKWPTSIAQLIANSSGATVWAYLMRSSQQKINGGYYQVCDRNLGYTEFRPDAK